MNKPYNILLIAFICLFSISIQGQKIYELMEQDGVDLKEVQDEAKAYFDIVGTGKGTGYKLFKRWEHHAYTRLQEDGTLLSRDFRIKSINEFKRNVNTKTTSSKSINSAQKTTSISNWSEMGPLMIGVGASGTTPGIGRITAIYVEPINQQLIYVGSPGGGLWKSINAGSSWTPLGDQFDDMSIWSVTCDPNNLDIVYYGDKSGQLFKSTDGGLSFTMLLDENGSVQSILINPNNSNEIYAAIKFTGLFRSTDGGNTWIKVISGPMEDVMYKPGSTSTIYACGNDFYKSNNSGISFSKITNGITASGRMRLAVTPANDNYVYVVEAGGRAFGWLYKSTDSGDSFTAQTNFAKSGDIVGIQASRNMVIAVSDTNAEEVHAGGLELYKSINGGIDFTRETSWLSGKTTTYLHGDQEDAFFVNGNMYVGSDGGIAKSSDNGASFTDLSVGLGIQQFYSIASSVSDKDVVAGAAQDNGPVIKFGTANAWKHWSSGDGVSCAVDPTNANIVYSCTQYGGLKKTVNGGASKARDLIVAPENNGGLWETPIVVDINDNKRVYLGYKDLYRHDNSAKTGSPWVNVSSNIQFSSKLSHINLCPSNENTVYVVSSRSLYKSTDILSSTPTWTEYLLSISFLVVNDVAVDPYDQNRVAVAASNGTVRLTTDGANTWTDISAGLPSNTAVQAIVFDRSPDEGIYAAIDGVVFYRSNTIPTWTVFSNNLPNVDITKLDLYYGTAGESRIRVATYGRGAWESPLYDDMDSGATALSVENLDIVNDSDKILIYPNPVLSTMHVQLQTNGEDILMTIVNLGGSIVSESHFKTHNGLNLVKVGTKGLSSGFYSLNILKGEVKVTKKFIVK